MDIKDLEKAMYKIEFVLYSIKNNDQLQAGEVEQAHKEAQKIIEEYLKPTGILE